VTSVAVGTCAVTFADSSGRSIPAGVTVTTLGVVVQTKSRQR
jgi:hypothetical protein